MSYVPWDVAVLNEFQGHILSSIGTSTNVGIKLFGLILGISLITLIIHKFVN